METSSDLRTPPGVGDGSPKRPMNAQLNGHSGRRPGMPLRALSNVATGRTARRAVVALAAADPSDLQRLVDALDASDIEVTELPSAAQGAPGPEETTPDVVAYVCDPS